jgi:hypothetical protein
MVNGLRIALRTMTPSHLYPQPKTMGAFSYIASRVAQLMPFVPL